MRKMTMEHLTDRLEVLPEALDADYNDALLDCGELVVDGIERNFQERSTADGESWPERTSGGRWPLLEKDGALKTAATNMGAGAIHRIEDGKTLETGVDKEGGARSLRGAAVQNFGYPPQNIPRREFLAISSATADACAERIADEAFTRVLEVLDT